MPKRESEKIRVGKQTIELSNLDKPLFTNPKITKGELIEYYDKISKWMIPHIKDRPLSLHRFPNGIHKEGFFQKNLSEYFPSWLGRTKIPTKGKKKMEMVVCNEKATMIYLANQAVITFHPWLSKTKKLDFPDRLIFDLDPSARDFSQVREGAFFLKEILEALGLKPFVMTTGSKGVHIVVPIKPQEDFSEVRSFARSIATLMSEEEPSKYTTEHRKNKRGRKIFIDYLRNGYGQTAVAPYSVRAIKGAPVAAPITWKEFTSRLSPQSFNIQNILQRTHCPWSDISRSSSSLKRARKKLEKSISRD